MNGEMDYGADIVEVEVGRFVVQIVKYGASVGDMPDGMVSVGVNPNRLGQRPTYQMMLRGGRDDLFSLGATLVEMFGGLFEVRCGNCGQDAVGCECIWTEP